MIEPATASCRAGPLFQAELRSSSAIASK